MLFGVMFETCEAGGGDTKPFAERRAYMAQMGEALVMGGPLAHEAGGPAEHFWLVEAHTTRAARELAEADPFVRGGLRRITRVYAWRALYGGGRRII